MGLEIFFKNFDQINLYFDNTNKKNKIKIFDTNDFNLSDINSTEIISENNIKLLLIEVSYI